MVLLLKTCSNDTNVMSFPAPPLQEACRKPDQDFKEVLPLLSH